MYGSGKHMFRVLIVNPLLLKSINMFELTEIAEYIYEGVVEPSYKNLLGKMPTVIVTAVKIEEKLPHQNLLQYE